MALLPRLTIQDLIEKVRAFPQAIQDDRAAQTFTLGLGIAKYFLGDEWIEHINPLIHKSGYMRARLATDSPAQLSFWRTADLGECLFNLQHVRGFDARIEEMKTKDPEAYVAELHVGRMIYINDWDFRFVEEQQRRGLDYDFEIDSDYPKPICVDAKCKIESTALSATTVYNTLTASRRQLPADSPGVFFIKVPQDWLPQHGFAELMHEATQKFFATRTGRVVSVVVYIEPIEHADGGLSQGHYFAEAINPHHRFEKDRDWRLLNRWTPPDDHWNKLPPKWTRLICVTKDGYVEPKDI